MSAAGEHGAAGGDAGHDAIRKLRERGVAARVDLGPVRRAVHLARRRAAGRSTPRRSTSFSLSLSLVDDRVC